MSIKFLCTDPSAFITVTQGNHTATQSTFAAPCIPLHDFNITLNGFDSSFRSAGNFNAITYLSVNVTTSDTIWFFDWNTCAEGGVGGININGTNYLTLDGFRVSTDAHVFKFALACPLVRQRACWMAIPFAFKFVSYEPRLTSITLISATRCASTAPQRQARVLLPRGRV